MACQIFSPPQSNCKVVDRPKKCQMSFVLLTSAFTSVPACLGRINSFLKHAKEHPIKSSFKNLLKTSSGNNAFVGFVVFVFYFPEVEMTKKYFLIRF